MKLSESLLAIAKKVIREAVGIGIEEAGARICGPTAWKYIKAALSPAVDELEHRFPKMFLLPEEAEKAVKTLSSDKAFEELISNGFISLENGQLEILAFLAQQNEILARIGKDVDDGINLLDKKTGNLQASLDFITGKLTELTSRFDALVPPKVAKSPVFTHGVSPGHIYTQAFTCLADAQSCVESGDAVAASEHLAEGRILVEAGLQDFPESTSLLVALGYIEKTQAQAALLQNNFEHYVYSLEKAAKCFAAALSSDPDNAGALNGMANVYFYHHDYDRAIKLGTLAIDRDPEYGAAYWDLALSLETRLKDSGPDLPAANKLKATYRQLEVLITQQKQIFTTNDLAYVRNRMKALQYL